MPDLPVLFSESAADRIGAATRWAELQQGMPTDGYAPSPGNGMVLVRTVTPLPSDYSAAIAALGNLIEKDQNNYNGNPILIAPVWIKDINNTALSPNVTYQARYAGTLTQDLMINGVPTPTILPLYLVQQAKLPDEPHYYPLSVNISEFARYADPLNSSRNFYDIGYGYVLPIYYNLRFSNFVSNNLRQGGVLPVLKIKKTNFTTELFGATKYNIVNYYSDPILVPYAVKIEYGKVADRFGGQYDIPVFDPTFNMYPYGFNIYQTTGYYICNWQLRQFASAYVGGSDYIVDALYILSKVPTTTTGGIGSGIGTGISGV